MPRQLTADDLLPLAELLTPEERVRLLRLIASPKGEDGAIYRAVPPSPDEFSIDDESLAWEGEGWETFG